MAGFNASLYKSLNVTTMKKGTFRKVNFTIEKSHLYGHYLISANYRGKQIKVITTDSEAYDWLDDDSNKEKYNAARKHCYNKIVNDFYNN